MPNVLYEPARPLEFLLSEANPDRSRENVVFAAGEVVEAGTVIGLTSTPAPATPATGNVGNGAMTVHTAAQGAQVGSYGVRITAAAANGGTFDVTAPDGSLVGTGTVGTRFTAGGADFTLADGATDFAVGDAFAIPVARGQARAWDPANADGSQVVFGIACYAVDASAGPRRSAVVARDATANGRFLAYKAGLTAAQKEAAKAGLASRNIHTR